MSFLIFLAASRNGGVRDQGHSKTRREDGERYRVDFTFASGRHREIT